MFKLKKNIVAKQILAVLFSVFSLMGYQSNGQELKWVAVEDENGNMLEKYRYYEEPDHVSHYHGKALSFYPSGKIYTEGEFRDNVPHNGELKLGVGSFFVSSYANGKFLDSYVKTDSGVLKVPHITSLLFSVVSVRIMRFGRRKGLIPSLAIMRDGGVFYFDEKTIPYRLASINEKIKGKSIVILVIDRSQKMREFFKVLSSLEKEKVENVEFLFSGICGFIIGYPFVFPFALSPPPEERTTIIDLSKLKSDVEISAFAKKLTASQNNNLEVLIDPEMTYGRFIIVIDKIYKIMKKAKSKDTRFFLSGWKEKLGANAKTIQTP